MRVLPPQKNDEMLRVIKTTILELNKQDMLFWNIGLEVSHLTMSPPLWPRHLEEYSTKLYAFKEKHEEFPMAVETTLSRGCRYLTADSILVRKKDDMSKPKPGKLLKTWLLSLINPKDGLGDAGWKLQQDWWASNGQSFPIMKLPAELRREILLQTLSGNIYPNARTKQGMSGLVVTLGSKFQNCPVSLGPKDGPVPRPDPPNYAILRVNRQMHYEAQKAAWEGTTKHFSSPMMIGRMFTLHHLRQALAISAFTYSVVGSSSSDHVGIGMEGWATHATHDMAHVKAHSLCFINTNAHLFTR
jgi:hypothetical protein